MAGVLPRRSATELRQAFRVRFVAEMLVQGSVFRSSEIIKTVADQVRKSLALNSASLSSRR